MSSCHRRASFATRACLSAGWVAFFSAASMPAAPDAEVVLHNFGPPPTTGTDPHGGVIRDSAGNLYGTTSSGGTANYYGVVYELDASGAYKVLHSFTGGADGGQPYAGVIRDSAGNLYGTTAGGGTANWGVVYKLDPAGNETVLYSFTGGADGGLPYAGVIRDSAGNLYGTTSNGGAANYYGVVYELDASGAYKVLHNFTGGADGGYPRSGVIRDAAGNLYGTTAGGGTANWGVVYKLDPSGNETVLYSFSGGADGGYPGTGVIRDAAGNLYGTTVYGGTANAGVVYKLDPTGHQTVLYTFTGLADGGNPQAGVLEDAVGNLYGTTYHGGYRGYGTVYKVDLAGININYTVLHSFLSTPDGAYPNSGVFRDAAGDLYGTASAGGVRGGIVYKLDTTGNETVLHSFAAAPGGIDPYAGVIRDSAGNLYGTTLAGGGAGFGAVYKLDPSGETVLYNFTGGADGGGPFAGVIQDAAGNLYGTTLSGGTANWGVVYKLDPTGHETVLHSFTGGADGNQPYGGVILDSAGNLYGTTEVGGAGYGVVYKLDPSGNETVLYSFSGGADGAYPVSGVIRDPAGNLYGTASTAGYGVVYKLDPSGHETVLHSFTGGADGRFPNGVIRDSAGNLYGTTPEGGTAGYGVVYKLDPAGNETVLHTFSGRSDGAYPNGVVRDSAGNLYGTTQAGGTVGWGVVYKLDPSGNETVLYSFSGGADGRYPNGVMRDATTGYLYGTTVLGGKQNTGMVFAVFEKPGPKPE
jgi:uncharacterized repeat protein (TIGR03803 family)